MTRQRTNWPLVSASAIPYRAGINQVPRAATRDDIDQYIEQFCNSAIMADDAGFDLLELHMAHGYLLASFLSPITNQRSDEYGGSLANRLRFPLELFRAVRAVWPQQNRCRCVFQRPTGLQAALPVPTVCKSRRRSKTPAAICSTYLPGRPIQQQACVRPHVSGEFFRTDPA